MSKNPRRVQAQTPATLRQRAMNLLEQADRDLETAEYNIRQARNRRGLADELSKQADEMEGQS